MIASGTLYSGTPSGDVYVELPNFKYADLASIHLVYDGSAVADYYIQLSNKEDVSATSTTAGDWVDSGISITSAATSASSELITFDNIGCLRARFFIDHTTGGVTTVDYCIK